MILNTEIQSQSPPAIFVAISKIARRANLRLGANTIAVPFEGDKPPFKRIRLGKQNKRGVADFTDAAYNKFLLQESEHFDKVKFDKATNGVSEANAVEVVSFKKREFIKDDIKKLKK